MPGFAEVDLVSPSGNSASGEFADSLDLTDVFTGWTETRAILGKSRQAVRKLMGWDRYDTLEAVEAMNDLYRNELRWWLNLFQPSAMKKVRVGSRLPALRSAAHASGSAGSRRKPTGGRLHPIRCSGKASPGARCSTGLPWVTFLNDLTRHAFGGRCPGLNFNLKHASSTRGVA